MIKIQGYCGKPFYKLCRYLLNLAENQCSKFSQNKNAVRNTQHGIKK